MMSVGNIRGVICNSLGKIFFYLVVEFEESDVDKMEELLFMGGYDVNV